MTTRWPRAGALFILSLAGALLAVAGLSVALQSGAVPRHVDEVVVRPVQRRGGEFGKALIPTGATEQRTVTRTCVPVRQLLWPSGEAGACQGGDSRDLARAGWGVAAFAAGSALWVASGAERRLRRLRRPTVRAAVGASRSSASPST